MQTTCLFGSCTCEGVWDVILDLSVDEHRRQSQRLVLLVPQTDVMIPCSREMRSLPISHCTAMPVHIERNETDTCQVGWHTLGWCDGRYISRCLRTRLFSVTRVWEEPPETNGSSKSDCLTDDLEFVHTYSFEDHRLFIPHWIDSIALGRLGLESFPFGVHRQAIHFHLHVNTDSLIRQELSGDDLLKTQKPHQQVQVKYTDYCIEKIQLTKNTVIKILPLSSLH